MALKVFLVEDESVIREGLRDNIPWEQYGFRFVGEAADGEMALPMIRKERPDVIITDIKMPFMDGLSLSHIVKQEIPETKIIIISGYDDFEYARQAIKEGVEQYLLKPITRSMLQKALAEVKEKIDAEQEQKNYLKKYQNEMHEYEQSFRRNFFEKVFQGQTPLQDIYEEAARHSLDINAPAYNLILMCVQEKSGKDEAGEECQECQEELMRYFLRFPGTNLTFRWSINVYGILVKGEIGAIEEQTADYLKTISEICGRYEENLEWYAAAGKAVERFSMLGECYKAANHTFSYRFFSAGKHILSDDMVRTSSGDESADAGKIDSINTDLVNPELIKGFLANGQKEEIDEFTTNFVTGISEAIGSKLFWDYLLLNLRFTVAGFVDEIGADQNAFLAELSIDEARFMDMTCANMKSYMTDLLERAVKYRDEKNDFQGKKALKLALSYIEENYAKESLSLNEVAQESQVSPNYFSAMFSQEMGQTFVEYVTKKRMDKAKELLLTEGIRSGDVGPMVGYKNPQYFSFVFKKTEGCSPREYRSSHTK